MEAKPVPLPRPPPICAVLSSSRFVSHARKVPIRETRSTTSETPASFASASAVTCAPISGPARFPVMDRRTGMKSRFPFLEVDLPIELIQSLNLMSNDSPGVTPGTTRGISPRSKLSSTRLATSSNRSAKISAPSGVSSVSSRRYLWSTSPSLTATSATSSHLGCSIRTVWCTSVSAAGSLGSLGIIPAFTSTSAKSGASLAWSIARRCCALIHRSLAKSNIAGDAVTRLKSNAWTNSSRV
mmetsp:Transcript_19955/g.55379  ORF Transcript_19955/g.55379 Transcript_19955/m.55379 type:complete len:241 (-) Transcript_19955:328-1050(-)